jgi:glyoxylase-like metal-dependent hydrolase (beta-lactamase superfamily II)
MIRNLSCKSILLAAAVLSPATIMQAESPQAIVQNAIHALHAEDVQSIEISGRGFDALFGQAYDGNSPWPRFALTRYSLAIQYGQHYLRGDRIRVQAQNPPLGGGNQPIGEQRETQLYRDGVAWNLGQQGGATAAPLERDLRTAVLAREVQILFTPLGFLQAALVASPKVHQEPVGSRTATIVSFVTADGISLEGTLDEQLHLLRIKTLVGTPVLGDAVLDTSFSDYKDFDGLLFPSHIVQSEGGYPLLDITVSSLKTNTVEAVDVPASLLHAKANESPAIQPQQYGDGIWILSGDDYHASKSILVEFKDYLLVIEAPDSEERSLAVIAAIHKLVPGKPIRYIVNTHTHFDHSGGLRTYAAEGAAVVTWQGNIPYYQQVWASPFSVHPDRLAISGKQPVFEGLAGSRTFSDGHQEIVVFNYSGNFHNPGMLAVYLPRQRAIIEADSFNPQPKANDPPTAIPNLVEFNDAVQRLGLAVDEIIPIHGRIAPYSEVLHDIDAYKDQQLWH